MDRSRMGAGCSDMKTMTAEPLNHLDQENGSQGKIQESLHADPPPLPWSSTAFPDEMLSDYSWETFESDGFGSTSQNSREPSVSNRDSIYEEVDVPDFEPCGDDTEGVEDPFDQYPVTRHEHLTTRLTGSLPFQDDDGSKTSYAVPRSQKSYAEDFPTAEERIETFDPSGYRCGSGSTIDLKGCENESSFQPPSILVSNDTIDEGRSSREVPETSNSATLLTTQIEMKRSTMYRRRRSMTLNQWSGYLPDSKQSSPNNYDLATQDRQPPVIQGRIDLQTEKSAAAKLAAFYADADSAAADVAAAPYTDTNLLHVKKPHSSRRKPPTFQTSSTIFSSSEHSRQSTRDDEAASPFQDALPCLTYPTPPSSSRNYLAYQHLDSAYTTEDESLRQSTSPRNSPNGPPSPISPSPSGSFQIVADITYCPRCPNVRFTGTLANRKNSLQRHIRDKHGLKPPLACLVPGCPITFKPARKDNRLKHVRAAHPDHPLPPPSKKRKRNSDSMQDT